MHSYLLGGYAFSINRLRMKANGLSCPRIAIPFLILALLLVNTYDAHASLPQKRVLVLYSEDKDHPAHGLTDEGIREAFRSKKLFDVRVYTEYLDASRFGESSHGGIIADYLRRKYSGLKIDAIIAVYPYAVNFLLREKRTLFPEAPVIAAEITRDNAGNLKGQQGRRLLTGTIMDDNISNMVDDALRLKPETKHIALIAGTAANDTFSEQIFRVTLGAYAGRFELIDLTKLSMEETLSRVASLSPDTLVFYSTIFRDGAGKTFQPREALSLVSRAAKVPVFGLYDSYLGFGIVGGRLGSFEEQGREAAALALRIMAGESPASIPFGGEQAYINAYDWRELKRWGINEKALPSGSIVKFKSPSIWEEHRKTILGGISFIIIETLLIIGLFVNIHKRRRANEIVRKSQEDYRDLSGKLLTAHETERSRLARELHDDLSQRLAALAIEAGFLERDSPSISQAAVATVHKIGEELVNLSGSIHDISRRLHPSILEDLGLADAIQSECDGLARREPIEVHFESRDCPPHPPLYISLCLYRITQESLRNIVKHARATQVHVSLTGGKDMIHLLIKDNGGGFNPIQLPREPGLGLVSMRERVRLIQGEIIIRSQPGQGTVIEIKAPLKDVTEGLDVGSEESL
jgi:signal transduction histidine kinase